MKKAINRFLFVITVLALCVSFNTTQPTADEEYPPSHVVNHSDIL